MENNAPIIVGLDIGTTKISVMIGRKDQFDKLEISQMLVVCVVVAKANKKILDNKRKNYIWRQLYKNV